MARGRAEVDRDVTARELTVVAEEAQLGRVRDFVVSVCEEAGFSAREVSNTKLAVDEACTNIIKHAYAEANEQGDIHIVAELDAGNLTINIRDTGKRFDFAAVKDPDLDQYVETGKKGGLGVFLINRLMDGVEYRRTHTGNELVLTKRSQAALSVGVLPQLQPLRSTLRFKFTMRAGIGLFILMSILGGYIFYRQSRDIAGQRTSAWMEKRRTAETLANRSVNPLDAGEFSTGQTQLGVDLIHLVESNPEIAWARVVSGDGQVFASNKPDEIMQPYKAPPGKVLLVDGRYTWRETIAPDGRTVREIGVGAGLTRTETGQTLQLGTVWLGVYEDALNASIEDNRFQTFLLLAAIFIVGMFLISGLVRVFVRPIQMLTDGVRAIGDGTMDHKLDVSGPAEIGAIAAVFNEMTDKFKSAQNSILEQEKMHKEMEVAKEIQHSLLPRERPEVSGYDIAPLYQAAAEVGGDYYDFVQVDEDTIGVVVADVSGKGVPGSLVMTMIRTALRMEARGNKNASDVMSKMNAFVTDDMKKGMFVTMFYVILDSKNRIISYASAGHNPMILYRHETRETFFLNPKGFPVGISLPDEELFRKSISLEKIKLKKDDMLLIYTDGVTEAMNERRDQYGEERLLSLVRQHGHLPPSDFIDRLENDVKKFTAGYPQNDDITVVAVKEKLAADDVLFGIRKKLIDLVDVQGMSVKEACHRMNVSPATYYRYKKRLELLGERGLKNKVLRQDVTLKRLSTEARKHLLEIIAEHPEYGAKRLTDEYNEGRDEKHQITVRMVYDELRRLNLNTRELREEYLRRNKLLREEDEKALAGKDAGTMVDDLLRGIEGIVMEEAGEGESAEADVVPSGPELPGTLGFDFEEAGGVGISVSPRDEVAEVRVEGHLDSVTSTTLERRLRELVEAGTTRIVVDLSDVTYVSSGGWGIFTAEVRGLRQNEGDLVLSGMSAEVYDVYELLGFADVLRAFHTVEEAHEHFALPLEQRLSVPVRREPVETSVDIDPDITPVSEEWQSLRIDATTAGQNGEVAVLELHGIIDTVSADRLRAALAKVLDGGIYRIVVDMSEVEYVSSGGWGTFTERLRDVRRAGGDIKLFGMDPDVYYVFTMLGFNIVLSSFDLLTAAIEDFERAPAPGRPVSPAPESDTVFHRMTADDAGPGRVPATEPRDSGLNDLDLTRRTAQDIVRWEDMDGAGVVAHLTGPIEASAVEALAASLDEVLAREPRLILFDLGEVRYVSSTGWGQFARCFEHAQAWGGRVALYGLDGDLFELYRLMEFSAFLPAYETITQALDAATTARATPPPAPTAPPPESTTDSTLESMADTEPAGAVDPADVDDIIGRLADAPVAPTEEAPSGPEVQRWPGEKRPGEPRQEEDWDAPRRPEPPAVPGDVPASGDVDVDGAVADKNIDRDQKLRDLGWNRYGEKLRSRDHGGRNPKREKDPDDDGSDGKN